MSQISELRTKIKEARTKFYTFKSKPAKDMQLDRIRELTLQLNDILMDGISQYLNIRHEGVIVSGGTDCLAKTEFGTIQVYAVNDKLSKSWYELTCCVSYKEGDKITFEIKNPHAADGQLSWIAGDIEGGTFDDTKYKELCKRDDLAFFTKPDGTRTGLFK